MYGLVPVFVGALPHADATKCFKTTMATTQRQQETKKA